MSSTQAPAMRRPKLLLVAGLLAVSTLLFLSGIAIERGWIASGASVDVHKEAGTGEAQKATTTTTKTHQETGETGESAKTPEQAAADTHQAAENPNAGNVSSEAGNTTILGLNLESTWVIVMVVLGSLLLMLALLRFGWPVLFLVLIVTILAMVMDVRELMYQMGQANTGITFLAASVVVTRVITAIVTLWALSEGRRALPSTKTASYPTQP